MLEALLMWRFRRHDLRAAKAELPSREERLTTWARDFMQAARFHSRNDRKDSPLILESGTLLPEMFRDTVGDIQLIYAGIKKAAPGVCCVNTREAFDAAVKSQPTPPDYVVYIVIWPDVADPSRFAATFHIRLPIFREQRQFVPVR